MNRLTARKMEYEWGERFIPPAEENYGWKEVGEPFRIQIDPADTPMEKLDQALNHITVTMKWKGGEQTEEVALKKTE